MIEINRSPSRKELRQFGAVYLPAFCAILGALLYWRWGVTGAALGTWASGLVLSAACLCIPGAGKWLFVGLQLVTFPIGWASSHALLAVVYYAVLTPVGIIMKAMGYDPMQRNRDPGAKTYWQERAQVMDKRRYFRQF
ncbi:MAG: hypothetical protein HY698_21315 [Deltaproteobacteria bacterium]|nr:hypothetical protein [Deltaproteobacteria bacterium]